MDDQTPIVCPVWELDNRRSHGGKRFHVQPLPCVRCGKAVAVPLKTWWEKWNGPLPVICELCSMLTDQSSDSK
jgi:hypothetical protein